MLNTNPLILKVQKRKYIKSFLSSLFISFLGFKMYYFLPSLSIIIMFSFGFSSFVSLFNLLPRKEYIQLDAAGFTIRKLFKTKTIRWNEVNNFNIEKSFTGEKVTYNLYRSSISYKDFMCAGNFLGCKETIPGNYGMNPESLVKLLERYREKYVWSNN